MKQRKKADRKPPKAGSRKATAPKRSSAPKAARSKKSAAARRETEVARLRRERDETLEQQAATAEVLQTINASPGNVVPVFDAILQKAHALCNVAYGSLQLCDGDTIRAVAVHGLSEGFADLLRQPRLIADAPNVQALLDGKRYVQVDDLRRQANSAILRASAELEGGRTLLMVPLRKEGQLLGMIVAARPHEVTLFSEKEIGLLENFAAQAVIAIENARLFNDVQTKSRDLQEALRYQTGSANILNVIASSPTDVEPVLKAIVESACELCEANDAVVLLKEGNDLRFSAHHGPIPINTDRWPIGRGWASGRAVVDRATVHVHDIYAEDEFTDGRELSRRAGSTAVRSILAAPLLREDESIGAILLRRQEVRPFNDKQIAMLQTFADQAVIAIENARLFNETREALERQTATADVLKVIAGSPTNLQPVFDALVLTGARLLKSDHAWFVRCDGATYSAVAIATPDGLLADTGPKNVPVDPETNFPSRVIVEKKNLHLPDWSAIELPEHQRQIQATWGVKSGLYVPLLRDNECIGLFAFARKQVGPFSERDIALAESFRDQALIAIENARLFNETKEALERQTATADVLKVIASSPTNLQPVFDAIAERSNRLIRGYSTAVFRYNDDQVELVAFTPVNPHADATLKASFPRPISEFSYLGARTDEVVQFADTEAPEVPAVHKQVSRGRGFRAFLMTPLIGECGPIGAISVTRRQPGAFADQHVQLLRTFADQAVIAIQNVKLFDELQAKTRDLEVSLQRQTATADVLKVISRSAFDLKAVLTTLVESARTQCQGTVAMVVLRDGDDLRFEVMAGTFSPDFLELMRNARQKVRPDTLTGRPVATGEVVYVPDIINDTQLRWGPERRLGEFGSGLSVPLILDGEREGAFAIGHKERNAFTPDLIELVKTFADQAVIAIKNVRLFNEVQARTRELSQSLDDLRAAQDRLVQTEKLASLGQLTAGIAHEIKNPLNFVNNFSALSAELVDEMTDVLESSELDEEKKRKELDEIRELLKGNLEKVVQHGKRADAIVKNMLLHSREGSGEHRLVDINGLVEESLNLAFHGARAEKQGFNITMERSLDPAAGEVDLFPQEITRVLLNLISNGFYAATKRNSDTGSNGYEPTLRVGTKNLGDRVEISIRDNGIGIPPEVKDKMFNPFFTTKPAGEGTGLGLSISHDIIVKQHLGLIEVETELGEFTEFRIVLPRSAARLATSGGRS